MSHSDLVKLGAGMFDSMLQKRPPTTSDNPAISQKKAYSQSSSQTNHTMQNLLNNKSMDVDNSSNHTALDTPVTEDMSPIDPDQCYPWHNFANDFGCSGSADINNSTIFDDYPVEVYRDPIEVHKDDDSDDSTLNSSPTNSVSLSPPPGLESESFIEEVSGFLDVSPGASRRRSLKRTESFRPVLSAIEEDACVDFANLSLFPLDTSEPYFSAYYPSGLNASYLPYSRVTVRHTSRFPITKPFPGLYAATLINALSSLYRHVSTLCILTGHPLSTCTIDYLDCQDIGSIRASYLAMLDHLATQVAEESEKKLLDMLVRSGLIIPDWKRAIYPNLKPRLRDGRIVMTFLNELCRMKEAGEALMEGVSWIFGVCEAEGERRTAKEAMKLRCAVEETQECVMGLCLRLQHHW